jgi:hypothetical protein
VSAEQVREWLREMGLLATDELSLWEWCFTYHFLFGHGSGGAGAGGAQGGLGAGGAALYRELFSAEAMGGGRRLGGGGGAGGYGARTLAEGAAAVLAEGGWAGTVEAHAALVRALGAGRTDAAKALLVRARDAFEALARQQPVPPPGGGAPLSEAGGGGGGAGKTGFIAAHEVRQLLREALSVHVSGGGGGAAAAAVAVEQLEPQVRDCPPQHPLTRPCRCGASRPFPTPTDEALQVRRFEAACVDGLATLPEVFAAFGFALEDAEAAAPLSVSAAVAMLRLHHDAPAVREACEAALRRCHKVLKAPTAKALWAIDLGDDGWFTKVGRLRGGRELLLAIGFVPAGGSASGAGGAGGAGGAAAATKQVSFACAADRNSRRLALGLVTGDGAGAHAVRLLGEGGQKVLRARCHELEAELQALDGAKTAAAALREMRQAGVGLLAVRDAADAALRYVTNVLRDPSDARRWRVRECNPAFQRALGRLPGGVELLLAAGFELRERAGLLVLRGCWEQVERGAAHAQAQAAAAAGKAGEGGGGGAESTSKALLEARGAGTHALPAGCESFLWRRKADLEVRL